MRYKLKEQDGFTLIIAIISLAVMSILGIAILSATTSNFKMTKVDSVSQSAYYIAEAGVNYMIDDIDKKIKEINGDTEDDTEKKLKTSEEFFTELEKEILKNNISSKDIESLKTFKPNMKKNPEFIVDIKRIEIEGDVRKYIITSTGEIGDSKRIVKSTITIGWEENESESENVVSDILFNVGKFSFNGSEFNALGKTIVIGGQEINSINGGAKINAKNIYFKDLSDGVVSGGTYGDKSNPGDIYLDGEAKILNSVRIMYGNVHTNGNFTITRGVEIHGNLIVKGNLDIDGGSKIYGNVYVDGNLKLKGGINIEGEVIVLGDMEADGGVNIGKLLRVDDNAKLVNVTLNEEAEIRGNLELDWTPKFKKKIEYGGVLINKKNIKKSDTGEFPSPKNDISPIDIKTIQSFVFTTPICQFSLKDKKWYKDNKGYEVMDNNVTKDIPNSAKWYVNRYENTKWQNNISGEVIIISEGDIILRGANGFRGALIAPNGIVKYSGGGTFNGVIISKDEMRLVEGGTTFNLKSVEEYFRQEDIPVNYNCKGTGSGSSNNTGVGGTNGNGEEVKGKIINITPIKEK